VRVAHPDLVIADILMPTMDGFEFVRQLRADPALAPTSVIFYTAAYSGSETRTLAQRCGVSHILLKPSAPETVLQTVNTALGLIVPSPPTLSLAEFDHEHLQLLTDKLSQKVTELEAVSLRLEALIDPGLALAAEHDPRHLLGNVCSAARRIIGAKYAVVGALDNTGQALRHFCTSGMNAETAAQLSPPMAQAHR
jgi:two-component system cell cycle sensor histidine kinase/response regulator CckA